MRKKIGIGFAVVIALLVVVIATRPAEFRIERSVEVAAAPAAVYPHLVDFHAWANWSPWDKLDLGMKRTFSGAPVGKGAVYEWSGNDKVGSGRMEITDVRENAQVNIKLDFITPFKASNLTEFTVTPSGAGSKITWAMTGQNNFMSKAFSLVMNMDKMVGGDFEKGLAELKRLAEAKAPPAGTAAKAP